MERIETMDLDIDAFQRILIFVIIIVIINSFTFVSLYSTLLFFWFFLYLSSSFNMIARRHLARNPFICDCNLRWLADYLHKNPIETSGARCDAPKRMHRRRIEALRDEKFKCKLSPLLFALLFLTKKKTQIEFKCNQIMTHRFTQQFHSIDLERCVYVCLMISNVIFAQME